MSNHHLQKTTHSLQNCVSFTFIHSFIQRKILHWSITPNLGVSTMIVLIIQGISHLHNLWL